MLGDIVSFGAAVLLLYFAYRDWNSDRFMAIFGGALALLILIFLGAVYLAKQPERAAYLPPDQPMVVRR